MMHFINLRAIRVARERRQFLERHFSKGDAFVLGAAAGMLLMFLLITAVHLSTR